MSAELQQHTESIDLVISNILSKHPVQINFVDCGKYLNLQKNASYVARNRGVFPVRIRSLGSKLICHTVDLIEYIKTGESQAEFSCGPIAKKFHKKVGRPTKAEQVQAQQAGISVSQMRKGG